MSRVIFGTGKAHQERAAVWARQRLADRGSRCFTSDDDQDGVLLADSVGMGKTWEAIAAAALILYKRTRPERGLRHVLILCPSNLVSKWEDELMHSSALQKKLSAWANKLDHTGHSARGRRVFETLSAVLPIRRSADVQTRKQRSRFEPPGGTYIISQTLIARPGRGLAALRRTDWDIVIVDEAHSAHAHKALRAIEHTRRAATKLLLSATPFQLHPRQWNGLAANLVKSGSKVMRHPSIDAYVKALTAVFESPSAEDPPPRLVRQASKVFSRLATRTVVQSTQRTYGVVLRDGCVLPLPVRIDALDDGRVQGLLEELRRHASNACDLAFETAYFESRLELALGTKRSFVTNRLRHTLSQGAGTQTSPRLHGLERWATRAFEQDIRTSIGSGSPEKTIVFTSLVGRGTGRDAERIRTVLETAFEAALVTIHRDLGPEWTRRRAQGAERLRASTADLASEAAAALRVLADDELTCVLAARPATCRAIVHRLRERQEGIEGLRQRLVELTGGAEFARRSVKRQIRDQRSAIAPWADGPGVRAVERYTGKEDRKARDRAATAFREIGPPWILVASNVGSEGIDLHTYTRRIVHYDLEWNPARMEQREGRGDRVGRKLAGKLEILYCLVPDTYDERMFHQLVARDRWHGVLLGKPALRLEAAELEAPILGPKRLQKLRLDLRP
jgi:superfamily II DNA or RNA helicase